MKQSILLLLTLGLLVVGLAGCGDDTEKEARTTTVAEAQKEREDKDSVSPATDTKKTEASAAGTAGAAMPADRTVDKADLLHHRFVLKSADGVGFFGKERVPELDFGEGFRVMGAVCNRFTGDGKLENGTLTVKEMALTRMLCGDPDLNALETRVAAMLEAGAELSFDGRILTLRQGGHILVYELHDRVQ